MFNKFKKLSDIFCVQIHPVWLGRDEHPAVEGAGVGEAGHHEGPREDGVRLRREAQGEIRPPSTGTCSDHRMLRLVLLLDILPLNPYWD